MDYIALYFYVVLAYGDKKKMNPNCFLKWLGFKLQITIK